MTGIYYQDGSALRDMKAIAYQDGATLRNVRIAYYQDGSTLRIVWPRLAATASPASASVTGAGTTLITPSLTIVVTGNPGTTSFSWFRVTDPGGRTYISNDAAPTVTWQATFGLTEHATITATWRCTITDSITGSVTVDVPVTITRT